MIVSSRLAVETRGAGFTEITREVADFLRQAGAREGAVTLFIRHTSASLTIQENADPSVLRDLATALNRLALIVRAADCGRPDLAKEAAGLLAVSKGLSLNFADDHEMLRHGMVVYDALYAWCADTPLRKIGRLLGAR